VPAKFEGRKFHVHNPTITLMRTTPDENAKLGEEIGRKVAASTGLAKILLPGLGVSAIDRAGQPFDDPEARKRLFAGVKSTCGRVECQEVDLHINDPAFAEAAANALIQMIAAKAVR